MKFQKAQAIVEFAFVLPLFLLLMVGLFYFGFAFADYLTVSNTTRSIAHEASIVQNDAKVQQFVEQETKDLKLISDIFIWNPKDTKYLKVVYNVYTSDNGTQRKDVVVTSHMDYSSSSYFGRIMKNFSKISPSKKGVNIVYTMYCPPALNSGGN